MSVHHTHTVTIACDHPLKCTTTFGPKPAVPAIAKDEAKTAGWYVGKNDKTYCPPHAEALGLRMRAAT